MKHLQSNKAQFERSIIQYLGKRENVSRQSLRIAKRNSKLWLDVPRQHLTAKINQTVNSLIKQGSIVEKEAYDSDANSQGRRLHLVQRGETSDLTAFENSIIAYLGKRKHVTRKLIRTNKCDGKPWSEIPRQCLTPKINETIDGLIKKGMVLEVETCRGKYLYQSI